MSGLHGAAKCMTLLSALGVATASRGAALLARRVHQHRDAELPRLVRARAPGGLALRQPDDIGRDDEACCCTSETCSGIIDAGITSSTACATEPPAGDNSLAVTTISIIVAVAVALLCPLGLLVWYLRLPAERRAAM